MRKCVVISPVAPLPPFVCFPFGNQAALTICSFSSRGTPEISHRPSALLSKHIA